jgi:hypothetical protein
MNSCFYFYRRNSESFFKETPDGTNDLAGVDPSSDLFGK